MSIDTSTLPVSGGVLLAAGVFAGACYFALGPLIATRTIEKSNWNQVCRVGIAASIEAKRSPKKIIPRTDCRSLMGGFFPELGQLCDQYGNPDFGGGMSKLMREQESRRQEVEQKRLAQLAHQSTNQCDCAASVVARHRDWVIHAGSLRLISPPSVQNLNAALTSALNTTPCNARSSS